MSKTAISEYLNHKHPFRQDFDSLFASWIQQHPARMRAQEPADRGTGRDMDVDRAPMAGLALGTTLLFTQMLKGCWVSGRSKTGYLGVYKTASNRFEAKLSVNGQYLGTYSTAEEAAAAITAKHVARFEAKYLGTYSTAEEAAAAVSAEDRPTECPRCGRLTGSRCCSDTV